MGRKPKDRRLETVKENLLERLTQPQEPKAMVDLLAAYNQLLDILERGKLPTIINDMETLKANAQLKARKAFPIVQKCEIEGCPLMGERHHDDYTKPLEIRWLCDSHHAKRHVELGDKNADI